MNAPASSRVLVDKTERTRRLAICERCPHRRVATVAYCGLCNCVLKLKTRLQGARCPNNQW